MCNNCIHKAVCGKYRATGGVKKCDDFMGKPKHDMVTAKDLLNSLYEQICLYANRHGEYPKCILASRDAYKIIEADAEKVVFAKPATGYVFGIEFRMIYADGLDMFLCDGPIPIRREKDG